MNPQTEKTAIIHVAKYLGSGNFERKTLCGKPVKFGNNDFVSTYVLANCRECVKKDKLQHLRRSQ